MLHEATDSGLACLVTMLRFYGIPVDPRQLCHRAAGQRFSLPEIVKGARDHGLKAKLKTKRVTRLVSLPLPAVVRKRDGAFQILAKIVDDKVLLHDPVNGRPLSMSLEEFAGSWDGTLILMAKRANLADLGRRFDISWFLQAMHKYRRLLGEVLLASFFLQVFALITPCFSRS